MVEAHSVEQIVQDSVVEDAALAVERGTLLSTPYVGITAADGQTEGTGMQ